MAIMMFLYYTKMIALKAFENDALRKEFALKPQFTIRGRKLKN
jgi:hypothetical protein